MDALDQTPDPQRSWDIVPPTEDWPTPQDVAAARDYKKNFGNQAERDINTGTPLSQVSDENLVKALYTSGYNTHPAETPLSASSAERLYAAQMSANKTPLSSLGFDPNRMTLTPTGDYSILGAYFPETDRIWTTNSRTTPVHESIHRGISQLVEDQPEFIDRMNKWKGGEETLVRALMLRHFGDAENQTYKSRGRLPSPQVAQARVAMGNPEFQKLLGDIERSAHYKYAKKLIDEGQGPSLGVGSFAYGGPVGIPMTSDQQWQQELLNWLLSQPSGGRSPLADVVPRNTQDTIDQVPQGFLPPPGKNETSDDLERARASIARIESGGNYKAMGPMTGGDRAYGRYQIMGSNIPTWTKAALGRSMTPDEFLADPEAQDAVFNDRFGGYMNKYGPSGAARAWFAGEGGMGNTNATDVLGTGVGQYAKRFMDYYNG